MRVRHEALPSPPHPSPRSPAVSRVATKGLAGDGRGAAGFTLSGLLISMSLMVIVLGAVISGHLFGLRMFQLSNIRLEASRDNARCFALLTTEVRAAKVVRIGQGTQSTFSDAVANSPQQGNAIRLSPSSDTNVFVQYFQDTSSTSLKRIETNGTLSVIATFVTNTTVFSMQDTANQVLTNKQNHSVLNVRLNFSTFSGTGDGIGGANHYTSYGVQTKIATRSAE